MGWAIKEIGGEKEDDWPEARSEKILFLDGGWIDWMRTGKKNGKWFDFLVLRCWFNRRVLIAGGPKEELGVGVIFGGDGWIDG